MILKSIPIVCAFIVTASNVGGAEATVSVDTTQLQGSRPLEEQTKTAAIRDYLESWHSLKDALEQNRTDLLDADFVGSARSKLASAIGDQAKLGIHTRYSDRVHRIQVVFYSPEGLSIELIDWVDYDVQVFDHSRALKTVPARARYTVILTPSEVRWRIRVLQADSQ